MKDTTYLIFTKKGILRSVKGGNRRGVRSRPALNQGEYACKVEINVSDTFFAERALPVAVITVPQEMVVEPQVSVTVTEPDTM